MPEIGSASWVQSPRTFRARCFKPVKPDSLIHRPSELVVEGFALFLQSAGIEVRGFGGASLRDGPEDSGLLPAVPKSPSLELHPNEPKVCSRNGILHVDGRARAGGGVIHLRAQRLFRQVCRERVTSAEAILNQSRVGH